MIRWGLKVIFAQGEGINEGGEVTVVVRWGTLGPAAVWLTAVWLTAVW